VIHFLNSSWAGRVFWIDCCPWIVGQQQQTVEALVLLDGLLLLNNLPQPLHSLPRPLDTMPYQRWSVGWLS
jgi:hypothetical protein